LLTKTQAANYVLAPLILVVFVIVVSFVLLNMVRCPRFAVIIARLPHNLLPQCNVLRMLITRV